jgi:hypothetical protein
MTPQAYGRGWVSLLMRHTGIPPGRTARSWSLGPVDRLTWGRLGIFLLMVLLLLAMMALAQPMRWRGAVSAHAHGAGELPCTPRYWSCC